MVNLVGRFSSEQANRRYKADKLACKTALSEFDRGANIIKFAEFKPIRK